MNSRNYEFVSTAKEDGPKIISDENKKTVNTNDPLHSINSRRVNSFQKEFREFASVLKSPAQKFSWFPKATKFFLKRCLDRKEKFYDSKIEKKLWSEILQEMHSVGFHIENEEILCQKMNNLKRNYQMYNYKNKSSKGRTRIIWPYFHILKELFPNDSSGYVDTVTMKESTSNLIPTSNNTKNVKRMNSLQYLRRKQQRTKEKKAEMAEKILETLKETTKLQEERNNLILELITIRNATSPHSSKNQIKLNLDDINLNNIFQFN